MCDRFWSRHQAETSGVVLGVLWIGRHQEGWAGGLGAVSVRGGADGVDEGRLYDM